MVPLGLWDGKDSGTVVALVGHGNPKDCDGKLGHHSLRSPRDTVTPVVVLYLLTYFPEIHIRLLAPVASQPLEVHGVNLEFFVTRLLVPILHSHH